MGLLKRFRFLHRDETGLGDLKLDEPSKDPVSTPMPTFEQSMAMQGETQQSAPFNQGFSRDKHRDFSKDQELKLISSKLDTLIAKMDNMNQRIANLERIAEEAQK